MNINIRPEDCRFIVKPKERKIICILEHTKAAFIHYLRQQDLFYLPHNTDFSVYLMPNRFVGVATCNIEDEWNEEIGKKVAFSRLKDKYTNSFFKRATKYTQDMDKELDKIINYINKIGEKFSNCANHRYQELDKILNIKVDNE